MKKDELIQVLSGGVMLAPMAGITDSPFRNICISHGASATVSEMVSAKALTLKDATSLRLACRSTTNGAYGVQIFASEPSVAAEAVGILCENDEVKADWLDLNCGCPAPKIVSSGCGSALMKDPDLVYSMVKQMVSASSLPVTVKIRAGYDKDSINAVEVALAAEEGGASLITVHGRTRDRMYAPPVDLDIIARVKESVKLPVIGNGDIFSPEDGVNMVTYTKCDGLMIGRGALGRPWFFEAVNRALKNETPLCEPTPGEKMDMMLEHIKALALLEGERSALLKARKHAAWYTKGIRGSASFRRDMNSVTTFAELEDFASRISLCEGDAPFSPPSAGNFCK